MDVNVENIKRRMLIKYPFFGSAVASLKMRAAKGLGTIGTDGKSIYYDPKFLSEASEEKQTFLFAHEICHIAFNHILRSEGKDKELWNIATDAVINSFLEKDGMEIPEDGVSKKTLNERGFDVESILGYNAEQLYNVLLKQKEQQQQEQQEQQSGQDGSSDNQEQNNENQEQNQSGNSGNGENQQEQQEQENSQSQDQQNNGSSGSQDNQEQNEESKEQSSGSGSGDSGEQSENDDSKNQDVGHDTHSFWDEAIKEKNSGKSSESKNEDQKQEQEKSLEDKLKEMQDKLSELGEKEAFEKNEQTREEQLKELLDALSKESKGAGSTTNSEIRKTGSIGTSKPLIDWRLWLREAISMDVDWSYQNAELEDGVVRPNLETYPIPETEIILDTSGSIHETLLKNFLRECKNILQASRVKVGCFDTRFYGFNEIRTLDDIDNMDYVGGGGTDFNVAVNSFTKRVENKIIFTDGDASMPRTAINAIWIVFGGTKINPPGGRVIHIDDEQLGRLYYENDKTEINRRRM